MIRQACPQACIIRSTRIIYAFVTNIIANKPAPNKIPPSKAIFFVPFASDKLPANGLTITAVIVQARLIAPVTAAPFPNELIKTEKTDSILWNSYDLIGALSEVFSSLVLPGVF